MVSRDLDPGTDGYSDDTPCLSKRVCHTLVPDVGAGVGEWGAGTDRVVRRGSLPARVEEGRCRQPWRRIGLGVDYGDEGLSRCFGGGTRVVVQVDGVAIRDRVVSVMTYSRKVLSGDSLGEGKQGSRRDQGSRG